MAKKLELLTLKSMHVVDQGELAEAFDEQLAACAKDCIARPSIDKPRQVQLTVELRPRPRPDGTCDDVVVECKTGSKAPSRPARAYLMRTTVNGGLKFQPDSPLDPDQNTFEFGDEDK